MKLRRLYWSSDIYCSPNGSFFLLDSKTVTPAEHKVVELGSKTVFQIFGVIVKEVTAFSMS